MQACIHLSTRRSHSRVRRRRPQILELMILPPRRSASRHAPYGAEAQPLHGPLDHMSLLVVAGRSDPVGAGYLLFSRRPDASWAERQRHCLSSDGQSSAQGVRTRDVQPGGRDARRATGVGGPRGVGLGYVRVAGLNAPSASAAACAGTDLAELFLGGQPGSTT